MSAFAKQLFKKHKINTYYFANKENNLYEAMSLEPRFGSGIRFAPKHWAIQGRENDFYEITDFKLKPDLRHGKVWANFFKDGQLSTEGRRVRGGLKYSWIVHNTSSKQ
ncbi:hypothetical protein DSO57_1003818 [Entomophthora muscae]|uniref:Uncharacterized protein n=2 Tax=Entomophthora muscae TaxID=34485 RepID=A0ACC2UHC7_9FUNG|nr:hypothetical protein DSO57_1036674 [Entomophthora muscae]KAJ9086485.1 hypothetical protein DSO57_1003818 [Entomophthora muscae]